MLQCCTQQDLVKFDQWRLKEAFSRSYILRFASTWLVDRWTSWQHPSPRIYHWPTYKPDIKELMAGARLV
jgi:hypothetical protein